MEFMKVIFWICIAITVYTYVGYGMIIFLLIRVKRLLSKKKAASSQNFEPEVTLLIAAYNEKEEVAKKMQNTLDLDYPPNKLTILWVTDGSTDGTPDLVRQYPQAKVEHQNTRAGKIGAINRGMKLVTTPITAFCDANTILEKESIRHIVRHFENPKVGCVAGEKRITLDSKEAASAAGEGLYWKYESTLKRWDSELYSTVGAAGELFAIRTDLFQEVEPDTLLDDFMISMRIAKKGFVIRYEPKAIASEKSSANVKEELKRKIRIAAGGLQSILRLKELLNIWNYGLLSFQYISHRVLRWTITPISLLFALMLNFIIVAIEGVSLHSLFSILLVLQLVFYLFAIVGHIFESRKIHLKLLFVPYYFFIMNYAVFLGMIRHLKGKQPVNWERARRA
jgi:cellulose synthase/poly-beta-1,6-N-acetylglucosamine synthase-like glycosyltransferase